MSRFVNSVVRPRENNQKSRVHVGPNGPLFENVQIVGGEGAKAALTSLPSRGPRGIAHFEDFRFEGFKGPNATITVSGAPFRGTDLQMNGGQVGIKLTKGALADIKNSAISNHQSAGIRTEESSIIFDNLTLQDNEIGLDIGKGTRGDVIDSQIHKNREFDVRIDRDVLVGVFDTTARKLYDIPYNPQTTEYVDAEWIASRILDTTDVTQKARWIVKLKKKVGWQVVQTAVWEIAKGIIFN